MSGPHKVVSEKGSPGRSYAQKLQREEGHSPYVLYSIVRGLKELLEGQ